jgi:hypothetical protein
MRTTEEKAVVSWPAAFENQKDVDWFVRVLYGQDMKQVPIIVLFCLFMNYIFRLLVML